MGNAPPEVGLPRGRRVDDPARAARSRRSRPRKAKAHGKGKAQAILASKLGRAVYVMLRRGVPFDEEAFMKQ